MLNVGSWYMVEIVRERLLVSYVKRHVKAAHNIFYSQGKKHIFYTSIKSVHNGFCPEVGLSRT